MEQTMTFPAKSIIFNHSFRSGGGMLLFDKNMTTEEKEIYELRELMGEAETIQDEGPTKGREQFRKYEYITCTRTLTTSNTKISEWLEHPNPKYRRDIYRTRCQHGIRCKGTKALTTTKPCLALHPFEWEMFPDEYIR